MKFLKIFLDIFTPKFENSKEWAKILSEYLISKIEKQKEKYQVDNYFSSLFVAWASWAWKTEFVSSILDNHHYIIIDIDKYRSFFKWYNWKNAKNYQDACSRVATSIFEYCLKNNLKFIFDWTLSSEMWITNIKKVIKKWRTPNIVLVYQDPMISYYYTKTRQEKDERQVSIESFLRIYYNSIKYCFEIQKDLKIEFIVASKERKKREKAKFEIYKFIDKREFDKIYKIEYNIEKLEKRLILVDNIFKNEQERKR